MTNGQKTFLDRLRKSGRVNMFGASQYLIEEFGIDKHEAIKILAEWMKSFTTPNA